MFNILFCRYLGFLYVEERTNMCLRHVEVNRLPHRRQSVMIMARWNNTARIYGRVGSVTASYGSPVMFVFSNVCDKATARVVNEWAFHDQVLAPVCVWWYGNIIVLVPRLYGLGASRHTNKLASSTAILNYRSQSFISANRTAKQKGRNEPQILNECNDCLQYFNVTGSYTTIRRR